MSGYPAPRLSRAQILPDATLSLTGEGISSRSVSDAWFFPDKWGAIDDAAPQTPVVADGKLTLVAETRADLRSDAHD